jgi:hypothetical protein
MRLIPIMLALLLALSPGAVAMQAAAPTASDAERSATDAFEQVENDTVQPAPGGNTTTVMTLGTDPARTAFESPSLSLGDSLAMDRDGVRAQLSVTELDQELASAESNRDKKQILNRYRYQIENQIISIQAKEERATSAFSNGTISEYEYLRTLSRINTEAKEIKNMIDAMEARSEDVSRFSLKTEASTLKGKLVTVEGPVRDRISRVIHGEVSPTKIYVATSDSGVVLSTIVGDTYVREIVRTDRYDPSATPDLSSIEANDIVAEERYPWAGENTDSGGTYSFRFGSTNVFSVRVSHHHGKLVAYLDGANKEVFKEVQHKRLTGNHSLPPGPGVVNSSDNATLTVNRTYPGGPLRVQLTNETGAPLQGQVTVAGEPVGRTNAEGVLWTLGPTEQFAVTATHEDATVNVTATPVNAES